ncbi:hypothetical protein E4T42_05840 [Aureobasidium subglaciale]|nr:hypothetical protein E4T42_05840 [Aureobasidium subglaciale]
MPYSDYEWVLHPQLQLRNEEVDVKREIEAPSHNLDTQVDERRLSRDQPPEDPLAVHPQSVPEYANDTLSNSRQTVMAQLGISVRHYYDLLGKLNALDALQRIENDRLRALQSKSSSTSAHSTNRSWNKHKDAFGWTALPFPPSDLDPQQFPYHKTAPNAFSHSRSYHARTELTPVLAHQEVSVRFEADNSHGYGTASNSNMTSEVYTGLPVNNHINSRVQPVKNKRRHPDERQRRSNCEASSAVKSNTELSGHPNWKSDTGPHTSTYPDEMIRRQKHKNVSVNRGNYSGNPDYVARKGVEGMSKQKKSGYKTRNSIPRSDGTSNIESDNLPSPGPPDEHGRKKKKKLQTHAHDDVEGRSEGKSTKSKPSSLEDPKTVKTKKRKMDGREACYTPISEAEGRKKKSKEGRLKKPKSHSVNCDSARSESHQQERPRKKLRKVDTPASTPQRARQTATTNSCSSASASLGHHINLESRSTPKHVYRGAAEAQKEVKGGDYDILTTIFIQEPSVYYKWTSYGHSLLVQSNASAPPKRPIFSSRLGEADVLRLRDTLKAKKKSSPSFDTEAEPEEKPMRQNYTNAKTFPVPEATASSKPIENLSKDIISCTYCHRQHSWNHIRCECGRCHFHRPDLPPPQKCSKCNKCHREEKCKDFVEEGAAEKKRKVVHKDVKTGDPSRSPDLDDQPKKKSRKYTGEGTAGDPMAID